MRLRRGRHSASTLAGAVILVAVCSSASGDLELPMEFLDQELPNHHAMAMLPVDCWPVNTLYPVTFIAADVDAIHVPVQVPSGKKIQVDKSCSAYIEVWIESTGSPDAMGISGASAGFTGVQGLPPLDPTLHECLYAQNGNLITCELSGFEKSDDSWSFTGVDISMDTSGCTDTTARSYFVATIVQLVEDVDSGQAFSRMVPEPTTISLLGLGGLALLLRRQRK